MFLVVQAFKYPDWITAIPGPYPDVKQVRLAIGTGLSLGVLWTAVAVEAQEGQWTVAAAVGIFYRGLLGSLVAALFYSVILKPLLERIGVDPKLYRWQPEGS